MRWKWSSIGTSLALCHPCRLHLPGRNLSSTAPPANLLLKPAFWSMNWKHLLQIVVLGFPVEEEHQEERVFWSLFLKKDIRSEDYTLNWIIGKRGFKTQPCPKYIWNNPIENFPLVKRKAKERDTGWMQNKTTKSNWVLSLSGFF